MLIREIQVVVHCSSIAVLFSVQRDGSTFLRECQSV